MREYDPFDPAQLTFIVLPVLLVFAFLLARTLGHVIFLFLTAAVIAFTLNPLVRDLTRLRLPRAFYRFQPTTPGTIRCRRWRRCLATTAERTWCSRAI